MFNVLEFVGGLGVTLLIVFAVTQVIVPELFGWPKYWIFDSQKRAKIDGAGHSRQPNSSASSGAEPGGASPTFNRNQPKLTNKTKR